MISVSWSLQAVLWLALALLPTARQIPLGLNDITRNLKESHIKDTVIDSKFSEYVTGLMDSSGVVGLTLAVVKPDGQVEFGAWGNKSEDGQKMTPDTLFNIASCSKAFLSASMGILIDDFASGRNQTNLPPGVSLDWDTKLKDILPDDWELEDRWTNEKANILDILSHVSGLTLHEASYSVSDTPKTVVRRQRQLRLLYELRERWEYTNQMYVTGAHIISKYTGSYINFAKGRIFHALGMNYTTFSPDNATQTGLLTQSWTVHRHRIPYWLPQYAMELNAGFGGIITNVIDLSKWLKTVMNSGVDPVTNTTVIPLSTFNAVTTASAIVSGKAVEPGKSVQGYGMGWFRSSYRGHEMVYHSGSIPGFSSLVTFFPHDNLGVAVLINTHGKASVTDALTQRIAENVLNLAHIDPPQKCVPTHTKRPANATTPLPLSAYSGTYGNAGYGSFTICDPQGTSFYCNDVLSAFSKVDSARSAPLPPPRDVPQLYAEWPRMWSSHIRFVHFEGNVFNLSLTALFPEGYGASKTPFEVYLSVEDEEEYDGTMVFVVQNGTVIGAGLMIDGQRKGDSVQERAQTWFHRL